MSFFSDLFEGNFGNLGNDITHAPSSLINHPDQLAETLGAGALIAAPFLLPEIGAAAGIGAGADAAAGAGLATDLGIADIGGAAAADVAAGAGALGADIGAGATDALAFGGGGDALSAASVGADPFVGSFDLGGGTGLGTAATDAGSAVGNVPQIVDQSGQIADLGGVEPAASGGEGGFTQGLKDFMGSPYTRLAAGLAPLALTLGMGQPKLPSQIGPAQANAAALAAQGPNLNTAQQAQLTVMRQNAVNAARQALFNQGVQNPEADTRYSQIVANIDTQVTAAAQTMIQQNIQNSLAGDQQLIQIAQMQMNADTAFSNNLIRATAAFGSSVGFGSGQNFKIVPSTG